MSLSSDPPFRARPSARLSAAACLLLGAFATLPCGAAGSPVDTSSGRLTSAERAAAVSAEVTATIKLLDGVPVGLSRDSAAFVHADRLLAEYMRPHDLASTGALIGSWTRYARRAGDPLPLYARFDEALITFEPTDTSLADRAYVVMNVGAYHVTRGRHRSARNALDSAVSMPQASVRVLGNAHYQLGYISYYRGDYRRASEHFANAAETYARDTAYLKEYIVQFDAAGSCAYELGDYERALEYTTRAVSKIHEKGFGEGDIDERRIVYTAFLNYAEALQATGNLDSALHYRDRGRALAYSIEDAFHRAIADLISGRIDTRRGALEEAERQIIDTKNIFAARRNVDLELYARRALIDLRRAQGRLEEALDLQVSYYSDQDSITRAQVNRDLDVVTASSALDRDRHETAILRATALRLEAENRTQRLKQLGLWGLVAILSLASAYGLHRYRARRDEHAKLEAQVAERTAELSEQAAALRRSNTELERFAYIASHDLKTPLRNVTSFLGLAERRLDPAGREAVGEYLAIAAANARQMHALVTDVLEFSRIDADLSEQSRTFDLGEAVRDVVARLAPEAQSRVTVTGAATVLAPASHLEQLALNLIENGLKYNDSAEPRVEVTIEHARGQVRLTATDNGIGIAPEFHEQVFGMFKRLHTSDAYQGTGLGLAVCRKVVERLGGSIDLASEPGRGSTFTVLLPAAEAEPTGALHRDVEVA